MKNRIYLGLLFLVFFLMSCEKDNYTVEGTITNITGGSVAGAQVNLHTEGTTDIVYSSVSDISGTFTFPSVKEGYYDLHISAEGYSTRKFSLHLKGDNSEEYIIYGTAALHGKVLDAQTGRGVDSVRIAFTTDVSESSVDNGQFILKTDKNGVYDLDSLPIGEFRLIIDTPVYFTRIIDGIEIISGTNVLPDVTLAPPPESDAFRIILSWGFDPADLDIHLTGPSGAAHICYWNTSNSDSSIYIELDDAWRYGPETMIIRDLQDGNYRFSVHNYSDQTNNGGSGIYTSAAQVEVYGAEGLVQRFIAPEFTPSGGNTWRVFEIQVSSGSVIFIPANLYFYASDDSDLEVFKMRNNRKKTKHLD